MNIQSAASKAAGAVGAGAGAGAFGAALQGQPAHVVLSLGGGAILAALIGTIMQTGERSFRVYLDYRYKMAMMVMLDAKRPKQKSRSP